MKKLILVYGAISGLVIIVINTLSIELGIAHVWLGFLVMFIAFSSIFVAVKQYRDETRVGFIRVGTGFLVGLGITVIASLVYVLVWELYLAMTDYAFIETIGQQYANPLFRLPMTFVEVFPIGVLISLISAFILRESKTLAAEKSA